MSSTESEMELRARPRRSWLFDVGVALFLLAISFSVFVSIVSREDPSYPAVVAPLLVVHSGCLAWRRRAPLPALVINMASGLAVFVLGFPLVVLGVSVLVALYTVATHCDRLRSLIALVATTVVMGGALTVSSSNEDASTIVVNGIVFAVAWFLGDSQRARRAYVSQLEQRTTELESARHELARSAVAEERLRIARELHDVVAHSMGMIAVQAGVGAHVIDSRPEEAKRSLQTIEQASKSALREIRHMLGLLRSTGERAETDPSPSLADLRALAEEVTQAGVKVDLWVDHFPDSLPAGMQVTIFRIVQEALTNTVKHAAATEARVSVRFADGVARIDVVDNGVSPSAIEAEGHGIVGMRERASMHGGTLDVARLPEGGVRVSAEIPLAEKVR